MNKYILFVICFYYRAAYINVTEYELMIDPNVSAVCYYLGLFC